MENMNRKSEFGHNGAVRVTKEQWSALERIAAEDSKRTGYQISVSDVIRKMIADGLERRSTAGPTWQSVPDQVIP